AGTSSTITPSASARWSVPLTTTEGRLTGLPLLTTSMRSWPLCAPACAATDTLDRMRSTKIRRELIYRPPGLRRRTTEHDGWRMGSGYERRGGGSIWRVTERTTPVARGAGAGCVRRAGAMYGAT